MADQNQSAEQRAADARKADAAQIEARRKEAEQSAREADQKAIEAREKEVDARKTPERREAEKAEFEASRLHSEAAQVSAEAKPSGPTTAMDAKVPGVTDPELLAGDPRAQRMGNHPANPKPAKHIPDGYDGPTVKLSLRSPDTIEPRVADVHPDMVGDYLRAGWEK